MKIPTTLKHKPVFVAEDYQKVDGRDAYESDAQGLSLDLAQWNDRGKVDISAKVWRYTGEKCSRQSEELRLHRVLDLALLILSAKKHISEGYRFADLYNVDDPVVERIALQGDAMIAKVCVAPPTSRKISGCLPRCWPTTSCTVWRICCWNWGTAEAQGQAANKSTCLTGAF